MTVLATLIEDYPVMTILSAFWITFCLFIWIKVDRELD